MYACLAVLMIAKPAGIFSILILVMDAGVAAILCTGLFPGKKTFI